jgi:phosphohistidine phosphatase
MAKTSDKADNTKTTCSLYLVRHAIAEERGDKWPDDTRRPLTEKGIARMREAIAGLDTLEAGIEIVLTSPLVRARQTADLLVDGLKPKPALDVLPSLAPGEAPAKVAEALGAHAGRQAIALVGHEPGLGELGAWLIGANAPVIFKKGGVCRIDVASLPPERYGQLAWLALPKMLRTLATDK